MYALTFSDRALKSLRKIQASDSESILAALEELAKDPTGKTNVKRLSTHADDVYRLRVGDYRVLYDRDDSIRIIAVIDVGHRKDIYR